MKADSREEGIKRLSNINIPTSHPYYITYFFLLRSLKRAAQTYGKGRMLDIGCGNKPYNIFFREYITEHIGCDIVQSSEKSVDVVCEATNIPLPDNSFDTILCTQVIEHVADHNKLIAEAYRLLKPGGNLILTGPMYWPLHEEPYDFFRFTKHGFQFIFEKSGFKVLEIRENGGKWSVLGQMFCLTIATFWGRRHVIRLINNISLYLDRKHFNTVSTLNYLVVGGK